MKTIDNVDKNQLLPSQPRKLRLPGLFFCPYRNNYPEKLAYGNGDSVEYTYDDQGRVTQQTYEDGDTVAYRYDNSGALATVTDSATGTTTTYYYDFTDRLMKYVETSGGHTHSVSYGYDNINNLTSIVETIDGVSRTTGYAYDDDNRITQVTAGDASTNYTYDAYGRISSQVTKQGDSTLLTNAYTYLDVTEDGTQTSQQVAAKRTSAVNRDATYTYTYDANGNITSVHTLWYNPLIKTFNNEDTTAYYYDSQNQLLREDNQVAEKSWSWTYDNAGNILSRTEYEYIEGVRGEVLDTVLYAYDDSEWGDLLTAHDGVAITYDEIGNPLTDGTWTYTWEHGRQLASMSDGTTTWNYTYNSNGMRTSRSNGTTTYEYIYNGDKLSQMTVGDDVLYFTYDASGAPLTMTYNGELYYYVTNLQGDVMWIVNSGGHAVGGYTYDAWGNVSVDGSSILELNPLRYRGYVYDTETGLYYLQSRYYNPEVGRFLNADTFASTGQGLLGNNMFAYCGNNPANRSDESGCMPNTCIQFGATPILYDEPDPSVSYVRIPSPGWLDLREQSRNIFNANEEAVIQAKHFAFYKGTPIIKVPGNSAFSFGVIFFGDDIHDENLVRHEYGHIIQLQKLGVSAYLNTMVIPSVIGFNLDKMGVLPDGMYYNQPWEYKADEFGRVTWGHASWASTIADIYWGIAVILSYSL